MTALSRPGPAEFAAAPFQVRLPLDPAARPGAPLFEGTLAELGSALRGGQLLPAEVPLLDLTVRVLERARAWRDAQPDVVGELLPPLAAVIALKARLLVPPEQADDDLPPEAYEAFEEVVEGVEALAELDLLVGFLNDRRRERQGVIPAPALDLGLARRERRPAGGSLAKLVRAARNAVREVNVPLLARERLTLQGALGALRAFGARLTHFVFGAVPAQDWGERTTYFSALLEGVKGGEFEVSQDEAYGAIEVRHVGAPGPAAAVEA